MDGFMGKRVGRLDAKKRIVVPLEYRELLGPEKRVVVVRSIESCVLLLPLDYWARVRRGIVRPSFLNEEASVFRRLLMSEAEDVALDKAGRIRIPDSLLVRAGIVTAAVFVGQGEYLELWSAERWDLFVREHDANYPELGKKFNFLIEGEPDNGAET